MSSKVLVAVVRSHVQSGYCSPRKNRQRHTHITAIEYDIYAWYHEGRRRSWQSPVTRNYRRDHWDGGRTPTMGLLPKSRGCRWLLIDLEDFLPHKADYKDDMQRLKEITDMGKKRSRKKAFPIKVFAKLCEINLHRWLPLGKMKLSAGFLPRGDFSLFHALRNENLKTQTQGIPHSLLGRCRINRGALGRELTEQDRYRC
eukprot:GHVT01064969.1.p1 GENE.GHVT01064969.1~~GHVT01064969.1.p1  ORF type:complete len:200 (-),score=1.21 GHVT01064969.1:367-966(-)